MTVKPMTVFAALKRYADRGVHVDVRAYNGQKTKRKITPEL